MLATEQHARATWWCPFSNVRFFGAGFPAAASMNRIRPATRWLRLKNAVYRTFFPRLHWLMRGKYFKCWGSGCSAWRWENRQHFRGYCGLAGKPHEIDEEISRRRSRRTTNRLRDSQARRTASGSAVWPQQ
jgi:hypothetical protein